jgi:hypothetical protein
LTTATTTTGDEPKSTFTLDEEGKIIPTIENFYRYCANRKLMGAKCTRCGNLACPPRGICQQCLGTAIEWVQLKGDGVLLTYTIIHFPPTQFLSLAPYAVGIVKLEEGPNLPAMIKNVDFEHLKIGMQLQIDFETAVPEEWPKWPRYFFKPPT